METTKRVVLVDQIGRHSCPCCVFLPDGLFLPSNVKVDRTPTLAVNPQAALNEIVSGSEDAVIVDTHGHAHLERGVQESYKMENAPNTSLVSLSCAVEPADWQACIDYASTSDNILCGLGVHPWYLPDLPEDYLSRLEGLLQQHPTVMVGEIGLCKIARFVRTYPGGKSAALELQRTVFTQQLKLAAKYKRPVSVHCVDQHGVLMQILEELAPGDLPPAIGMHSYTGTAHHVDQLVKFEKRNSSTTKIYFGFSHLVNFEMCFSNKSRRQGIDAIRAVPFDRLMSESDVHASGDVAVGTAGAISYLAYALSKPVTEVAVQTAKNGIAFLRNWMPQRYDATVNAG
jgi:Tat protein secretion system quality control protein TatD with DNase activity